MTKLGYECMRWLCFLSLKGLHSFSETEFSQSNKVKVVKKCNMSPPVNTFKEYFISVMAKAISNLKKTLSDYTEINKNDLV